MGLSIKDRVMRRAAEVRVKMPTASARALADAIVDEFPEATDRTVYDYCKLCIARQVDESEWVEEEREDSDRCLMDFERRQYNFFLSGVDHFDVEFDEVSELIRAYVHNGMGMTQAQVCRYACSPEYKERTGRTRAVQRRVFLRMLKTLNITKASAPFAPHEFRESSVHELTGKWREQDEAAVEIAYNSTKNEHYKKLYEAEVRRKLKATDAIKSFAVTDAPAFTINIKPARSNPALSPYTAIIQLSDWHVGAVVDLPGNQFNRTAFAIRLHRLLEEIEEWFEAYTRPVDRIVFAMNGDLIDGPNGNMRSGQQYEQDLYYEEQTDRCSRALASVFGHARGLFPDIPIDAMAVGGNHGRGTASREDDPRRLAELQMYQTARAWTAPLDVDWNICGDVIQQWRIHSTQVIQTHGDRMPRDSDKLLRAMLDKSADWHLLLTGHRHHRQVVESEVLDALAVQNGSLIGDTPYGIHQLGVGARPSQRIIEVRENGPVIPGTLLVA